MLWKCCTQYASKFGKLSSGHRTGKGQSSFQSLRKATPKNAQTIQGIFSTQGSNPHFFMSTTLAGGFLPLMPPGKLLSRKQLRLPGIGWLACHSLLITGQVRIPGIRSGQLPLSPVVPDPLCFSVLLKPVTLSKFPLRPSLFSFSLPASSAVANLIDSVNK